MLSTSFTSLAIATGFERRYGVLKRLGASPLPRWGLLVGKIGAVLVVEVVQLVVLVGRWPGWSAGTRTADAAAFGWLVLLAVLGTAAFGSLGLLIAGTLRAEATLAVANLVYVLLLVGGGLLVPLDRYPGRHPRALELLPSGALGEGLRDAFDGGSPGLPSRRGAARLGRGRRRSSPRGRSGGSDSRPLGPDAPPCERWAWASVVANTLIVLTGGLVRLTGSGLGCPTWPRCTDESFVPHRALGVHGVIEFGNRMLTYVLVAVAVATLIAVWRWAGSDARRYGDSPWCSRSASRSRASSAASRCSPTSTRGSSRCTCCSRWR